MGVEKEVEQEARQGELVVAPTAQSAIFFSDQHFYSFAKIATISLVKHHKPEQQLAAFGGRLLGPSAG